MLAAGATILLVINTLRGGGAERFIQVFSRKLCERGYDVHVAVFTTSEQHYKLEEGVRIIDLGRRCAWDVMRVWYRLRRVLRTVRPRVVLSVMDTVTVQTFFARACLQRAPRLFCQEVVVVRQTGVALLWRRLLLPLVYAATKGVVCVSQDVRLEITDNYAVPERLASVIPYGVDIRELRRLRDTQVCDPFIKAGKALLVTTARLNAQKDHNTLLSALALVNQKVECNLIVFGEGELKTRLEVMVSDLGLTGHVWFAGLVENPFAYYKYANAFVLSTHYEGMPNVVLEAMAIGLPVVCSKVPGGIEALIKERVTGLLVAPGDAGALANAILELLGNATLRTQLSEAAQACVEREYSADAMTDRYLELF